MSDVWVLVLSSPIAMWLLLELSDRIRDDVDTTRAG